MGVSYILSFNVAKFWQFLSDMRITRVWQITFPKLWWILQVNKIPWGLKKPVMSHVSIPSFTGYIFCTFWKYLLEENLIGIDFSEGSLFLSNTGTMFNGWNLLSSNHEQILTTEFLHWKTSMRSNFWEMQTWISNSEMYQINLSMLMIWIILLY